MAGAEPSLYGLEDAEGCPEVVFVEGEIDKLSLAAAGIFNVVSLCQSVAVTRRLVHACSADAGPAAPCVKAAECDSSA